MQKKTCPNGHVYDPSIYGDQCPLCPPTVASAAGGGQPATHIGGNGGMPIGGGMHTHIAGGSPLGGGLPVQPGGPTGGSRPADPTGSTQFRNPQAERSMGVGAQPGGGHTVIRHAGGGRPGMATPQRRLVGFLVTYNRDPNGKAYNIYEGRNFIGRGADCDISIPDDDQMSSKHLSILYRPADGKFKFRDEQSSNGTFVNRQLLDDGELKNYDILRVGNTLFIFMAIPLINP